jgi:hypothetical protein
LTSIHLLGDVTSRGDVSRLGRSRLPSDRDFRKPRAGSRAARVRAESSDKPKKSGHTGGVSTRRAGLDGTIYTVKRRGAVRKKPSTAASRSIGVHSFGSFDAEGIAGMSVAPVPRWIEMTAPRVTSRR